MKAFTNIEQSKKLAEILPVESADMFYDGIRDIDTDKYYIPHDSDPKVGKGYEGECPTDCVGTLFLPCWSLAALLEVMPKEFGRYTKTLYWFDDAWHCDYMDEDSESKIGVSADNPVDVCIEMIYKLKEKDLL